MELRSGIPTRRWQLAIAVVAALSLFVNLLTSSALRHQFSAATLPEPAAWTHSVPDASRTPEHSLAHSESITKPDTQDAHSWRASPVKKKPFHSMWMTQHRPESGTRLDPESQPPDLRTLFANLVFRSAGAHTSMPAAQYSDRQRLTFFCVLRC